MGCQLFAALRSLMVAASVGIAATWLLIHNLSLLGRASSLCDEEIDVKNQAFIKTELTV